ncbi:MAG: UTP--glucose-1-phosphate uridylyltransferase [Eubacterium sp.]
MTYNEAYKLLEEKGQLSVLRYYDELSDEEKKHLLSQIEAIDWKMLELVHDVKNNGTVIKGTITPLRDTKRISDIEANKEEYMQIGKEAIRAGKVAAVLLAGGQGTRLGSDKPKGMYNIGKTKDVYIFEMLIRNLLDVVELTHTWIPLFIMTSDKNNEDTINFFKEKKYFGYNKEYIYFFVQEMAPSVDYNGKLYLEDKYKLSMSPNGNGGWFSSFAKCGLMYKAKDMGVEWLNVFAVDNVCQRIADPCFIGATLKGNYAVGAKAVAKAAPDEKVGVLCLEDGKPSIVEYYELTDELMNARDDNGEPAYNYGVILNYLFRMNDLEQILNEKMPVHIVEKKIPYINSEGEYIKPDRPNGYKFETLILDMIHLLDTCLAYEVVRNREFAPIKNKTGIDSVESAQALLHENGVEL